MQANRTVLQVRSNNFLQTVLHQASLRATSESVLNFELVLHISAARELALSQENWFQSHTKYFLV